MPRASVSISRGRGMPRPDVGWTNLDACPRCATDVPSGAADGIDARGEGEELPQEEDLGDGRYQVHVEGATEDEARDAVTSRLATHQDVSVESVEPIKRFDQ
jgi:hypothetical protein